MNQDRQVRVRVGLGLGVIVLTLLLLPLGLNWVRGGAAGVGVDPRTQGSELIFAVTWEEGLAPGPLDGRLVLIVARDSTPEPRFRVEAGADGQQVFGLDVRGWETGTPVEVTDSVFGFPLASSALIPPGDYWVQGVLDRYRRLEPAGGPEVWLPTREDGLPWSLGPGNLVSRPVRVRIDPRSDDVIRVDLSRLVPEPAPPVEGAMLRAVRIPSERLSAFWGREIVLEAAVVLPSEWESRPETRWPVVVSFAGGGGGGAPPAGAGSLPVEPDAPGVPSPGGAPALVVHPRGGSPYYPGFLPVDSENLGPWAEALVLELVPEVERRFRGMGGARARALWGDGLAGGWLALAAWLSHPDAWGGLWAPCLPPFRLGDLAGMSLHGESSAYLFERAWGRTPRPGLAPGGPDAGRTLEQENHLELVLGSRGRSGGWWDGWQAAYSPRGEDGYPRPVWDKRTGEIHSEVVAAWRARPDLAPWLGDDGAPAPDRLAGLHLGDGAFPGVPGPGSDACVAGDDHGTLGPPPAALAEIVRELAGAPPRGPGETP